MSMYRVLSCVDRMWSTGEGNGKPLQYSCLENLMNSMKRQNGRILKGSLRTGTLSCWSSFKHFSFWVFCSQVHLGSELFWEVPHPKGDAFLLAVMFLLGCSATTRNPTSISSFCRFHWTLRHRGLCSWVYWFCPFISSLTCELAFVVF